MEFLLNLDAFRQAIPTIHTLRLCNQFGKGENAVITKLPKELIGFIEEALLAMHRRRERRASLGWTGKYRCYEGTCRPREHVNEVYSDVYDDGSEYAGLDYEIDSDSDMSVGEVVWEMCWDQKSQWQSDVRKHMEDSGNSKVSTAFGGSRDWD